MTGMETKSYSDILPCPFCGQPPLVDDDGDGICCICCATDDCVGVEITCPTLDDAKEFWNRRAPKTLAEITISSKICSCPNRCDDYQNIRTWNPFANCGRCGTRLIGWPHAEATE